MTMPNLSEPAENATLDDVVAGTDTPTPVEPEAPAVPTTGDEPSPSEEAPSPEAADADAEPISLQEVTIPNPRPDQPPLTLAGLPQEGADAIRHLANTAAKADQLQERVSQLSEDNAVDRATLALLKESPLESMFLIHQQNPTVGKAFAAEWLQMNAAQVLPLLKDLNILEADVDTGELRFVDPRTAKLLGENARYRAEAAVDKGRKGFEDRAMENRVVQRAKSVIEEVAATLALPAGKRSQLFRRMAADELATLVDRNLNMSAAEMTVALQELATEFHTIAQPAKGKTITVRDGAGRFAEQQAKAALSKKLGSGTSAMPVAAGFTAPGDNDTLDDIINPHR